MNILIICIRSIKILAKYNLDKENKILIVFDDMIADMIKNKELNSIVTELFIKCRKLNISFIFITQSYFKVPKDVRLNITHFFIMKISNKRELQQIAINHSSDINTEDFIEIYGKCTDKPYSFLVIDTALSANNRLRFRKILNIINDDYQCSNKENIQLANELHKPIIRKFNRRKVHSSFRDNIWGVDLADM